MSMRVLGSATIVLFLCWPVLLLGQEKKETPPSRPDAGKTAKPDSSRPEKEDVHPMHAAPKRTPVHEQMAKRAGEYTTSTKFTFPGGEPQESTGTAKIASVLDGLFLTLEETGTSMGAPFRTLKLMGYDSSNKQFQATWAWTNNTNMLILTGTSSDEGKTVNYTTSYESPEEGKMTLNVSVRHVDDDHFVVTMKSLMPDGSEGAVMETTYTRKK